MFWVGQEKWSMVSLTNAREQSANEKITSWLFYDELAWSNFYAHEITNYKIIYEKRAKVRKRISP